jgi:hypothetical protein
VRRASSANHSRLSERFALLHRHDAGDVFGAFPNQLRGMAHQFAALEGGYFAPDLETALGRLDGFGEIGFGGE